MIKGVGIDIVKTSRIGRLLTLYENGFIRKVLHVKEIQEYKEISNQKKKVEFVSSRWSVKEALVKASGNKSIVFSSVYIQKERNGRPILVIDDMVDSEFNESDKRNYRNKEFFISISHEDEYACGVVVIQDRLI